MGICTAPFDFLLYIYNEEQMRKQIVDIHFILLFIIFIKEVHGFCIGQNFRKISISAPFASRKCKGSLFNTKANSDSKSKNLNPKPKPLKQLERLTNDQGKRLIAWIEENGGLFHGAINQQMEGWKVFPSSKLPYQIPQYTELIRIPKALCLYSNPEDMKQYPYHEYLSKILSSIDETQWRTRLGLILLSERVNSETKFHPYIMNLPFEIWGIPIFFDFNEIHYLQNQKLKLDTKFRCRYLSEFAEKLFPAIYKSIVNNKKNNPFYGRSPDVNSFGWGFTCASSRALQRENIVQLSTTSASQDGVESIDSKTNQVKETSAAVIIPGIDLLSHSFDPNCVIIDDPKTNSYVLYNTKDITTNDELKINYGPFSNLELFSNYGFTVYPNPNERYALTINHTTLNLARVIMGQTTNFQLFQETQKYMRADFRRQYKKPLLNSHYIGVGLQQNLYDDQALDNWQTYWLKSLQLYSPTDSKQAITSLLPGSPSYYDKYYQFELSAARDINARSITTQIDSRLLALLRILYSKHEEDLLALGYDPYLLGERGSLLSNPLQEAHVIKTLIGILLYEIRSLETNINTDLQLLSKNQVHYEEDYKSLSYLSAENQQYYSQAIFAEKEEIMEIHYDIQICHQILKEILHGLKNKQEQAHKINQTNDKSKQTVTPSSSPSTKKSKKGKKLHEEEKEKETVVTAATAENDLQSMFSKIESMIMERLMLEPPKSKETHRKAQGSSGILEQYRLLDEESNKPLYLASSQIFSHDQLTQVALKTISKQRDVPKVVMDYITNTGKILEPLIDKVQDQQVKGEKDAIEDEWVGLLLNEGLSEDQKMLFKVLLDGNITMFGNELRIITTEIVLYEFAYMIEKYLQEKQQESSGNNTITTAVSSTIFPKEYYSFIELMIEGLLTQNQSIIQQARRSFLEDIYDPRIYLDTPNEDNLDGGLAALINDNTRMESVLNYQSISADYERLNELGKELPINIRESLRYRIRRKLFLYESIEQLITDYQFLQSLSPNISDIEDVFVLYQKRLEKLKKDKSQKQVTQQKEIYFFSDTPKSKEMIDLIVSDPILKTSNEISHKWSNLDVDL